ncbi:MAG: outer membrane protein [Candidatus Eiseniibacteriota bacterium]
MSVLSRLSSRALAVACVFALVTFAVRSANAEEAAPDTLEPLVPELAGNPYQLEPGPRKFANRLSVSPAFGWLGDGQIFSLRVAYNPNSWLGYEGAIGHNPGQAVHAVLHNVSAIVRHPLPGRIQPYVKGGYGMIMVSPGPSLNADPVTKNALTVGGGVEFYLRTDVAIRAESQLATVLGSNRDRDGTVAYNYFMSTIGLSFYRSLKP